MPLRLRKMFLEVLEVPLEEPRKATGSAFRFQGVGFREALEVGQVGKL